MLLWRRRSNHDYHVNEEAHNDAQACIRELGVRPCIQSSPLRFASGISLLWQWKVGMLRPPVHVLLHVEVELAQEFAHWIAAALLLLRLWEALPRFVPVYFPLLTCIIIDDRKLVTNMPPPSKKLLLLKRELSTLTVSVNIQNSVNLQLILKQNCPLYILCLRCLRKECESCTIHME